MDANLMAQQITPVATVEALATLVGALMCLAAGVLWVTRKRVSPALAVLGVLLGPAIGIGMGWAARGLLQGTPSAEDAATAFYLAVGSRMLGVVFAFLPVAAAVLLAGFAGARSVPRRWAPAGIVGTFVLLTVIGVAVGGVVGGRGLEVVAFARAALYFVVGIPVVVAALSGDPENGAGPEAGAGAAAAFAAFVGIGEVSSVAFVELMMHMPIAKAASKAAYLQEAQGVVAPLVTWGWAAIATSTLGALAAMGFASLSGKRAALTWLAAPLLLFAPVVHGLGPLGPQQWKAYADTVPSAKQAPAEAPAAPAPEEPAEEPAADSGEAPSE